MERKRPTLFDSNLVSQRRERADSNPVDFLRIAAVDDVEERLNEVNRSFNSIAVVTPRPSLWANSLSEATFVKPTDVLQLGHARYDLVVHDLCMHWANDPVGQLVQCRQALVPDGLFIATLFGGRTLNELRSSLAQAETEIKGGLSGRVSPMAEIRDLGGLLQRAGLALPVADGQAVSVSYASALHLMKELRQMGESNALVNRTKTFTSRSIFSRTAELYHENFSLSDDRIAATFEIITLTGWAPDATQQQALRPGTASTRLAEALGTVEKKLKPF